MECSYPIDQATSSAFLSISANVQGIILMATETYMHWPLSEKEMEIQTCSDSDDFSHEKAQNYSPFLILITSYLAIFVLLYTLLFNPKMKRSMADHQPLEKRNENPIENRSLPANGSEMDE